MLKKILIPGESGLIESVGDTLSGGGHLFTGTGGLEIARFHQVAKRAFEFTLALLYLALLLPLFSLIALAIRWSSKGPVFYRHERIGERGRPFAAVQFRTTAWDGEDGPRITRVGRLLRSTCLDELPQLINILRGEVSFVGPRPIYRHLAGMATQKA